MLERKDISSPHAAGQVSATDLNGLAIEIVHCDQAQRPARRQLLSLKQLLVPLNLGDSLPDRRAVRSSG